MRVYSAVSVPEVYAGRRKKLFYRNISSLNLLISQEILVKIMPEATIASYAAELKNALHQYPNFPQEGILFEDFLPIFRSPELFKKLVKAFKLHIEAQFPNEKVDYIVGLESRGFLFGPTLALELNAGFVPVRKAGKLPGKTHKATYVKEYGEDVFEIQTEAIPEGANVIIVDDIIATGGSAKAAEELVLSLGANLLEFDFVLELDFLKGTEKLSSPSFTLLSGQTEALK